MAQLEHVGTIEPDAPTMWPSVRIVHAMQRGLRAQLQNAMGMNLSGVRSLKSWVYYAVELEGAVCERCAILEKVPACPTSRGLNGKAEALFGPQTKDYALFLLSWLNGFARRHSECLPKAEASA